MDKRQRIFVLIVASAVALFFLVLVAVRAAKQQTFPISFPRPSPAWTYTSIPLPPKATPSVSTTTTISPSPTNAPPSSTVRTATETATATTAGTFYVSPDGTESNDGSKESPWPLQYVLDQPDKIKPGDTIWLLEGKYTGKFTSQLKGEQDKPITVRAMPGQRVILENDDLVLDIADSQYVNFWGLEITATENSRDPDNPNESAYGIRINQGKSSHDIKFINLIVHDMPAQGFGFWQANSNSEIYGCLIYFNGITQLDHGIYVHNNDGEKSIVDNIIFDNASHGIHAYGEKDYQKLKNITIEGNTVFNNGSIGYNTKTNVRGIYKRNILIGGLQVAENPVVINNYTYYPSTSSDGEAFNLGYRAGSEGAVVENNYFAGGQVTLGGLNQGMKIVKNTILGMSMASIQGLRLRLTASDNQFQMQAPAGSRIFIRPNHYEPGRANITVYNWEKASKLAITADELKDVHIQKGDHYELHNAQNFFDDVITGTYDGERIELPMTDHTVAEPLGMDSLPASTFPEFGAFVLIVVPENGSGK